MCGMRDETSEIACPDAALDAARLRQQICEHVELRLTPNQRGADDHWTAKCAHTTIIARRDERFIVLDWFDTITRL